LGTVIDLIILSQGLRERKKERGKRKEEKRKRGKRRKVKTQEVGRGEGATI
jgi:hypothetical protein